MRIAAVSDLHGYLPSIEKCDILCICGDTVPLKIQSNIQLSSDWLRTEFLEWIKSLPCEKVILIAGNHDFVFERGLFIESDLKELSEDKLIYLEDSEYVYNGIKFYGTPWCEKLWTWAFFTANPRSKYSLIPDCDVLLTHEAPNIGNIGRTAYGNNYGSQELYDAIATKNIKYSLCGHIHSGSHEETMSLNPEVKTKFYNVAIKDENYIPYYDVLYLDI